MGIGSDIRAGSSDTQSIGTSASSNRIARIQGRPILCTGGVNDRTRDGVVTSTASDRLDTSSERTNLELR